VAFNTTILAHRDAVWGGRQPPHLDCFVTLLAMTELISLTVMAELVPAIHVFELAMLSRRGCPA
jgi:hypothetical protein